MRFVAKLFVLMSSAHIRTVRGRPFSSIVPRRRGTPHEYQVILEEDTNVSRTSYLAALQRTSTSIRSYKDGTISSGIDVLTEAINGEARNREPDKIEEVRWFRTDEIPGNLAKTAKNAIRSYLGQPLLTTRR
jgi:hypothetical protein